MAQVLRVLGVNDRQIAAVRTDQGRSATARWHDPGRPGTSPATTRVAERTLLGNCRGPERRSAALVTGRRHREFGVTPGGIDGTAWAP